MRRRALVISVIAVVLAGCCSVAASAVTRAVAVDARKGTAYDLYTHCGIKWAEIHGKYWRAERPLSDGHGNPPAGWGNPYQAGTLVFRSRTVAEFASRAGDITFRRTDRKTPPLICS